MFLQSLQELFAPSVDVSNAGQEDFHVLQYDIAGFDVGDIERRATAEKLAAWHVCCAAWSIVLSRHTSQSSLDFLATDVSRQSTPNDWRLSSCTKVHASVDEDHTFSELLHKAMAFSANDNQSVAVTTSSNVVIYPLMFSAGTMELLLPSPAKSDVTIQLLSKRPKTIQATCTYRGWLPRLYAEKVVHHFLHLLRHITNHRDWALLCIRAISMLSLEEELQLRHESLPGCSLADMEIGSVHQLVRRQARRTPNRPALQGADSNVLCYQELDLISDLMAEDLRHRLSDVSPHPIDTGLAVDSAVVVGIMLQRSPAVVVAILSCWKAGYAIVLLDPSQPISRNGYIIEDCDCALLLVDESWTGGMGNEIAWKFAFDSLSDRVKTSDDATQSDRGSEIDLSKDLFRPAWIRITSGSTGRPKCALHSHATFGASIASYARRIRGSKTLLFFNPISSASGNAIWSFLTNGGCVCIPSQSEMTSDLAGCINRYGIDDLCITPSALSLTTPDQVPALKTVSLVGEATPRSLGEAWSQHVSLLIGYGATEMNSHSLPFHDEPTGDLPPAHALPTSDYSLYILRPGTMNLCPLYVPGEICLSSTYMSSGYISMAEATSQVFVPHPFPGDAGHTYLYRTGDLGMFIGNRRFVLVGRVDFQFKVDGNRIQPAEIESIINQISQVRKSRVVLVKPSVGRPVSTCCVILKEISINSLHTEIQWNDFVSAAKGACADHLPAYMMPHRWLRFEKFPETPTSKTDTKALTMEAKNIIDKESPISFSDDYGEHQERISMKGRLFLDLALQTLTDCDPNALPFEVRAKMQAQSFIANGGSSLSSLRLRSQLGRRGVEVPVSQLYSLQSLIEIASGFVVAEGEADEIPAEVAGPALTVTEALLPRMPTGNQPDLAGYEAVFPTTMLQREMFAISMVDPKPWLLYQFFDLSQVSCTASQLHEAISLLVSAKRNLRTVFSLVNVQINPTAVEDVDNAFDLIEDGGFVQAILKPDVIRVAILQEDDIEEPEMFWRKDVNKAWSFARPLWRVAFLSKPRLLAWTLHHAVVDEWIGRNISRDLHAVLMAVLQRDCCQQGWPQALTDACEDASKPSIEQWVIAHYGTLRLDGSPTSVIQDRMRVWGDFMADATPTPIPDELQLPYEALPAPPLVKMIDCLPYGDWCRRHHVTAAALFHAVNALTIARLLNWWRPSGPQHPAEEVTYYRLSSNRATTQGASDMEGALSSISPMRVPVAAASDAVAVAQSALKNWLATHESDPYYVDERPVPTGPGPMARRRRWGNVLLNHVISHHDLEGDQGESFRGTVQLEDKGVFAMVWPFGALEMTVIETDSQKTEALHLAVLSTLERQCAEEFMGVFVHVLRLVVETGSRMSAMEIVQQS